MNIVSLAIKNANITSRFHKASIYDQYSYSYYGYFKNMPRLQLFREDNFTQYIIVAFLNDIKLAKLKSSFFPKSIITKLWEKNIFFHMKSKFLSSVHTVGHAESAKLLRIPQGWLRPL